MRAAALSPDVQASIGAMRHQLTLRSVTRAKDAVTGYATDGTTDGQTLAAEVLPESGDEPFQAGAQRGLTRFMARIRYRTDISAGSRVLFNGQTLEVLEPPLNRDGRRRFLWLRLGLVEST